MVLAKVSDFRFYNLHLEQVSSLKLVQHDSLTNSLRRVRVSEGGKDSLKTFMINQTLRTSVRCSTLSASFLPSVGLPVAVKFSPSSD